MLLAEKYWLQSLFAAVPTRPPERKPAEEPHEPTEFPDPTKVPDPGDAPAPVKIPPPINPLEH